MNKLDEQRKKYDIPEIPYLPLGKNVLVYRITGQEKTAGGIFIPEEHREVKSRGVLLAAGLAAMDILADGLVELGDEVCCAHFAGRDRKLEDREVGEVARSVWEMKVEDILGSVDAVSRRATHKLVRDEETNEHMWRKK